MNQPTAVVLDNDPQRRDAIRSRLHRCGVLPVCFQDEWICLENLYHLRPAFGVYRPATQARFMRFISVARAVQKVFPVILMVNPASLDGWGAVHWIDDLFFLPNPSDEIEWRRVVRSVGASAETGRRPILIAGAPSSQRRIERLPRFADSNEPLLIDGEPGVGKRLMTRAIHFRSPGDDSTLEFVPASDVSGRWIRALRNRIDRVTTGGHLPSVFVIQNVERLTADLQSQLLLILDGASEIGNGSGGYRPVRVISLAETDLERLSRTGGFRKDLYHRLSVLKLTVPPLRDRREDVPVLADFFAAKYGLELRGAVVRLPDEVRAGFQDYDWPGNVEQLRTLIRDALQTESADWLDQLKQWCGTHIGPGRTPTPASDEDLNDYVRLLLETNSDISLKKAKQRCTRQIEMRILKAALSRTSGNCKQAAALLNISYKSMLNKAKEYRLS